MSLLTLPDASGDDELCKTINRAYQILTKGWAVRVSHVYKKDVAKTLGFRVIDLF